MNNMLIKKNKIPVKEILIYGLWPSFIKKAIYRLKGYKIGKNVSLGFGSVIVGDNVNIEDGVSLGLISVLRAKDIDLGRYVRIGSMTMIDTLKVVIGEDSRINENVIVGGIKTPESIFKVGKRVIIMEYSFINPTKPVIIGDDSGIGGHCLLFTHGSWLSQLDGFPVTFAPITIGERVWLPWRVFIMPGVEIGDEVVIGANSLVAKDLPSNVLAAGSPAKVLVEDYPKSISLERRMDILNSIIKDFCEYLMFNDFEVLMNRSGDDTLINVQKSKAKFQLFISMSGEYARFESPDNLLLVDGSMPSKRTDKGQNMVLDIGSKKRIGSTKIGEEFVKFVSRYGVRFDRID